MAAADGRHAAATLLPPYSPDCHAEYAIYADTMPPPICWISSPLFTFFAIAMITLLIFAAATTRQMLRYVACAIRYAFSRHAADYDYCSASSPDHQHMFARHPPFAFAYAFADTRSYLLCLISFALMRDKMMPLLIRAIYIYAISIPDTLTPRHTIVGHVIVVGRQQRRHGRMSSSYALLLPPCSVMRSSCHGMNTPTDITYADVAREMLSNVETLISYHRWRRVPQNGNARRALCASAVSGVMSAHIRE